MKIISRPSYPAVCSLCGAALSGDRVGYDPTNRLFRCISHLDTPSLASQHPTSQNLTSQNLTSQQADMSDFFRENFSTLLPDSTLASVAKSRVGECYRCKSPDAKYGVKVSNLRWCETCLNTAITSPDAPLTEAAGSNVRSMLSAQQQQQSAEKQQKYGRLLGSAVHHLSSPSNEEQILRAGIEGEQQTAKLLRKISPPDGYTIHAAEVPGHSRTDLDHIVSIGRTVWVIDTKNLSAASKYGATAKKVKGEFRLFVGDRDRTELVEKMSWQNAALRKHLGCSVEVRSALCFAKTSRMQLAVGPVSVVSPDRLVKTLKKHSPPLGDDLEALRIAHAVVLLFPPIIAH